MASPRISPSGEWIAYQDNRQSHVVSRSGAAQPRRLGEGASQWCSIRDELLLEQPYGLSLFTAANGWAAPVRSIPDAALPVVFSPDGGEMVYSQRVENGAPSDRGSTGLLCRVNVGAAGPAGPAKTILSCRGDGLIPFAWIGDALLYWVDPSFSGSFEADGLELFRVAAAGGEPHSLRVTTLVHGDFLALSPAGDRVAITAGGGRESWGNKRIALIDGASGAVRYLTDQRTAAICPSWSPDGTRIAFVALPEGADRTDNSGPERLFLRKRRIWVTDASGNSQPVRLTGDDRYRDEEPVWLADGRHLLSCRVERGPADTARSIWLMDEHGGGVTQAAGPLQVNDTFEGEYWFGYYGTIDWPAVMDCHRGRRIA